MSFTKHLPTNLSPELVKVVLLLLIGAVLYQYISRKLNSWLLKRRFKRGAKGEETARRFLVKKGFKILGAQSSLNPKMWVDGQKTSFNIRADFLVSRKGRKGVVEVKTGKSAPNPKSSATRRQIFEYSQYYQVDDVYLFDAEVNKLHEIKFEKNSPKGSWFFPFIAGGLVGAFIVFVVL